MRVEIVYHGNELYFITEKIETAIDRFVNHVAKEIESGIQKEAPVQTGDLYRSFKSKPMGRLQALVYSNLHYAGIVNDGRGPIEAKNGKALRFRIEGQEIFVKRVGPAKPNPYVERGIDRAKRFDELLTKALREVGL